MVFIRVDEYTNRVWKYHQKIVGIKSAILSQNSASASGQLGDHLAQSW